jgi:hypothetical protein
VVTVRSAGGGLRPHCQSWARLAPAVGWAVAVIALTSRRPGPLRAGRAMWCMRRKGGWKEGRNTAAGGVAHGMAARPCPASQQAVCPLTPEAWKCSSCCVIPSPGTAPTVACDPCACSPCRCILPQVKHTLRPVPGLEYRALGDGGCVQITWVWQHMQQGQTPLSVVGGCWPGRASAAHARKVRDCAQHVYYTETLCIDCCLRAVTNPHAASNAPATVVRAV